MESSSPPSASYPFFLGMMTGTVVGAGLALWLTPGSVNELRDRVTGSARTLGQRASAGYDEARGRVGHAVNELARQGNLVRDDVADSVVRGAHEVERFAVAAKSDIAATRG